MLLYFPPVGPPPTRGRDLLLDINILPPHTTIYYAPLLVGPEGLLVILTSFAG